MFGTSLSSTIREQVLLVRADAAVVASKSLQRIMPYCPTAAIEVVAIGLLEEQVGGL